jgi:hypothetical protein
MPALGEEQIKRSVAFWEALETGVMPEVKVKDDRCKTCIYRRSCPRSQELMAQADKEFVAEGYVADDSLAELVSDYKAAREIAEEKQETVDLIKAQLQEAMGERSKVEVPSCGVRISWSQTKPPMRWDSKAVEGTAQVLAKFDIPATATCEFCEPTPGQGIPPAVVVVDQGKAVFGDVLMYACEPCGFAAAKSGAAIVARKGVSEMIMNCKRAGEPSRPFKVLTL